MREQPAASIVEALTDSKLEILEAWRSTAVSCFDDGGAAAERLFAQLEHQLATEGPADVAALERHVVACLYAGKDLKAVLSELSAMRDAVAGAVMARVPRDLAAEWLRSIHQTLDGWIAYGAERYFHVRLRVLMALDRVVDEAANPDELLQRLLRICATEIGAAEVAAIALFEGSLVRAHAAYGFSPEVEEKLRFDLTAGFTARVMRDSTPVELFGEELAAVIPSALREEHLSRLYAVPIVDSRTHGAFGVAFMGRRRGTGEFSEEAKATFRMLAHKTGSLLQQAMVLGELERAQSLVIGFLDHSPAIVFLKDLQHRYLLANRRMQELVAPGKDMQTLVGKTTAELYEPEIARVLEENDDRVVREGRIVEMEQTFRRGGEDRVYLLTRFPIRDFDGEIVALGGIASDVTVRKRREEHQGLLALLGEILLRETDLDALLNRVADCLLSELADVCLVEVRDLDGQLKRVARAEDLRLRAALSRPTAGSAQRSLDGNGRPVLVEKVGAQHLEVLSRDAEDREAWEAVGARSLAEVALVARGHRVGTILLATTGMARRFRTFDASFFGDVAARIALTVDNALLYAAAARAVADRDELAGVVAHDLRGPLNVIVSALELLLRGGKAVETVEAKATVALRSAHRMTRLIDDLLDMKRMEGGRLVVRREQVSLCDLVRELGESHASEFTREGRQLLVEVEGALTVYGDRDRLAQVVENLLSNALKFTPRGGRVTLGARPQAGMALVFVRDTGAGVAPENLRNMFTRFWQAARGDRRGAGLGLAIADGLVRAHGGKIWADSTPGAGTTLTFLLPLHQASQHAAADTAAVEAPAHHP